QQVLNISYPATGVLSYLWQGFDVAGNRTESRQYSSTNGALALWATNLWTFDGLHRPITQTVGDGATTSFGWDAADNLLSRTMPGGLSWHGTYNNASQMLREY